MKLEQEVDIFHTVKHLRYHRPQLIQSMVGGEKLKLKNNLWKKIKIEGFIKYLGVVNVERKKLSFNKKIFNKIEKDKIVRVVNMERKKIFEEKNLKKIEGY